MSCACEQRKLGQEYGRIRRLAKGFAEMEGKTVVIYRNHDGTYNFTVPSGDNDNEFLEYITPY